MPNPLNIPITPPRVAFIDPRSGTVSREWYLFFLSLFQSQGGSSISLDDVQKGPPPLTVDELTLLIDKASDNLTPASGTSELQAALDAVRQELQILPCACNTAELEKQIQALAVAPNPLVQLPWSSVVNQPRIEAFDSSASIALTATPALLKPASTTANSRGIVYDAATGEFTFSDAGSYTLALSVNAVSSAANQFVYIYAENNTGAGWVVNANSGKTYELINANMVQIVYSQAVARVPGQKVRYWIYSNDVKVTLQTFSLPGGVGAIVPAIRIQYS